MKDDHINIFYSEPHGGYIADIPRVFRFGKTPAEALAQLVIAKSAWLETARAEDRSIPVPRYKPDLYSVR